MWVDLERYERGFDFQVRIPLNSAADVALVATMASEIGVSWEAMGK